MSRIVSGRPDGRQRQQVDDFALADGIEIAIPASDGAERIRLCEAHDPIGERSQGLDHVGWCDRSGDGYLSGAACAGDLDGGPDCCAGCNAVVDNDCATAREVVASPLPAQPTERAFEFEPFTLLDLGELLRADPGRPQDVLVHDDHAVLADCPHRQFRVVRNTELAHHDDVQRRGDRGGDLGSDWDPSTRQPQNHRALEVHPGDLDSQQCAGGPAIGEDESAHRRDAASSARRCARRPPRLPPAGCPRSCRPQGRRWRQSSPPSRNVHARRRLVDPGPRTRRARRTR